MTQGYTFGDTKKVVTLFFSHYRGKKIAHAYFWMMKAMSCAIPLQFQANKKNPGAEPLCSPALPPGV